MSHKSDKSILKRFKITKNKKVLFRPMHQSHFNAGDSGNETRQKRKRKQLKNALKKKILKKYYD